MNGTPVSTANPTSTITEPPLLPPGRTRLQVRLKSKAEARLAVRCDHEERFTIASGYTVLARPGDWILTTPIGIVIDVLSDHAFRADYETAETDTLTLSGQQRAQLETALGFGATATGDALVAATDRLARLVIGNVEIPFTPGQWEEIAYRAQKMGLTVDALCQRIAQRVLQDFWAH